MPCYHPTNAYRLEGRRGLSFHASDAAHAVESFKVACGQCHGCRLDRASSMGLRCLHEAKMQIGGMPNNQFVTLTYNNENLPEHGVLLKEHIQKFMRDLRDYVHRHIDPPQGENESLETYRARLSRIRYYACGEYGPKDWRPHYHLIIFGFRFPDLKRAGKGKSGMQLFQSDLLDKIWGKGFGNIGDVTFKSASYVARYCMKKINGVAAEKHYGRVDLETGEIYKLPKEFALMSLKPGIGESWFRKYGDQVKNFDYVVVDGRKVPVPKYYDRLLVRMAGWMALEKHKDVRKAKAEEHADNNTPERLAVREVVSIARSNQHQRDRY